MLENLLLSHGGCNHRLFHSKDRDEVYRKAVGNRFQKQIDNQEQDTVPLAR